MCLVFTRFHRCCIYLGRKRSSNTRVAGRICHSWTYCNIVLSLKDKVVQSVLGQATRNGIDRVPRPRDVAVVYVKI